MNPYNPDNFRWICPVTSHACAHSDPCRLQEDAGQTMCKEWILRQQRIGKEQKRKDFENVTGTAKKLEW